MVADLVHRLPAFCEADPLTQQDAPVALARGVEDGFTGRAVFSHSTVPSKWDTCGPGLSTQMFSSFDGTPHFFTADRCRDCRGSPNSLRDP